MNGLVEVTGERWTVGVDNRPDRFTIWRNKYWGGWWGEARRTIVELFGGLGL